MLEEFERIGRDMFLSALVSSHGGNMSVRVGDRMIITRRGARLGRLTAEDLVETDLYKDDSLVVLASSETPVHRAVYLQTSALAIIHAHPRTAIALSMLQDEIIPVDNEGSYLLHRVPVISSELASGLRLAEAVSAVLRQYKVIMVRGHGCFAIGQLLEECYQWVSCLEESAQILYYLNSLGGEVKEYRRMAERYTNW
jgi:L-fuculose-phosphate aldolase